METRLNIFLFAAAVLLSGLTPTSGQTSSSQFRAYWVDAFGPGLYTEAEIEELVAEAKAANLNAVVAQIGRRGDCFCNLALMPRTETNIAAYPFDPLQTLIEKAHAEGLEVHAWISATAVWSSPAPPKDRMHVFNVHGPSKNDDENWLTVRYDGVARAGPTYYLDPGHPNAADYIVRMYASVVANYDVDGIHLDHIRYPDFNLGESVPSWGYNPVALGRFRAATGRYDRPAPSDPQWTQWRREQVTSIVRRIYLEIYRLKPQVRISAATVTYGEAPQRLGGWVWIRPYLEVLQDWRGWMEEGILDLNIPMNYKREHQMAEPDDQRRAFEEWAEFIKDHQYARHAAIGTGLYLNLLQDNIAQIDKALAPSVAGNFGRGWVGFSYRQPDILASDRVRSEDVSRAELRRALAQSLEGTIPVFATPAKVPAMPWKTQPAVGHLMGKVHTLDGRALDQLRIDLYDQETGHLIGSRISDGSGWFGFVNLKPGQYRLVPDCVGVRSACGAFSYVSTGQLTELVLPLSVPFGRSQ